MPLIGTRYNSKPEELPVVILLGESNPDGRTLLSRMANPDYNYKGIAAGYPAVRTSQAQYPYGTIPGTKVYWKQAFNNADHSLDNGSWQNLVMGVNSAHDGDNQENIGPELSLCTRLHDYYGKTFYLVKCCFAGTGISSTLSPGTPGNWNNTCREIAMLYYLERAVRDLRLAYPGRRLLPTSVNIWTGVNDAQGGITKGVYKAQYRLLRDYIQSTIDRLFVVPSNRKPVWNIVNVKFNDNAAESVINTGHAELVAENPGWHLVDCRSYPRDTDMTTAEKVPSGNSSLTNHQSYIAQQAVGELCANNIINAGVIL